MCVKWSCSKQGKQWFGGDQHRTKREWILDFYFTGRSKYDIKWFLMLIHVCWLWKEATGCQHIISVVFTTCFCCFQVPNDSKVALRVPCRAVIYSMNVQCEWRDNSEVMYGGCSSCKLNFTILALPCLASDSRWKLLHGCYSKQNSVRSGLLAPVFPVAGNNKT